MPAVLHLLAHPGLATSRVNAAMRTRASDIAGVTRQDLFARYPHYEIDIAAEQARLLAHDVIMFQFPLFWYSGPALLKEWIDLTLEYGFAYGKGSNRLHGEALQLAVTTGGTSDVYSPGGHNQHEIRTFLTPFEQTARLSGMRFAAPYVLPAALRTDPSAHAAGSSRLLDAWATGRVGDGVFSLHVLTHDSLPIREG